MQRILVIGSGGAGKSTLAAILAERLGLPLVHLDRLNWRAGWEMITAEELRGLVEDAIREDRWVIDGNYAGTLELRLARCDTVIFLDLPRSLCLWRATTRWLRYRGRTRPDMTPGCDERMTLDFVRWIWNYPSQVRPAVLRKLEALGPDRRAIRLRSPAEVRRFVAGLS